MPAIVFSEGVYGVKIVSRYPERNPSITADILLYSLESGELLGMIDGTWITAARTGAVAALAVETFSKQGSESLAIMGLGATGLSFLRTFGVNSHNRDLRIKLLRYKDHADKTRNFLFSLDIRNIEICETRESLIRDSDVIVSAVTVAENLIGEDAWFEKGCLVVPIHTRGFQNCDLFFDKVYCDDRSHVEGFKNFSKFRFLGEMEAVLKGTTPGRESAQERILSYNIGIALHDVLIAKRIANMLGLDLPNLHH